MNKKTLTPLLTLFVLSACTWDEGLVIEDLTGTVVIPREAATRTFVGADGSETSITDVRLIGPVILGLFPGVEPGLLEYPHPTMGPVFQPDVPGDTYPYGGTTVGDIRYACMEFLTCKVVSGRYVDFDDMVDWFTNVLHKPILDSAGNEVTNGDYIRQTCYELLNYTSDEEIRLTASDSNEDGTIDLQDLDFIERDDGNFEAKFTIWQQQFYEGFSLWGWMDAPSDLSFQFSTCDSTAGYSENEYNMDYDAGRQYRNLLNFPSVYISSGDWVATDGIPYQEAGDKPELWIDFAVEN